VNSKGQIIPLKPVPLGISYDLSQPILPSWPMYDNGKMDGADKIPCYPGGTPREPQPAARDFIS
jgi:hypothetical protein